MSKYNGNPADACQFYGMPKDENLPEMHVCEERLPHNHLYSNDDQSTSFTCSKEKTFFHPVTTIIDRVIAINNARNFTSLFRCQQCVTCTYKIMVMFSHVCLCLQMQSVDLYWFTWRRKCVTAPIGPHKSLVSNFNSRNYSYVCKTHFSMTCSFNKGFTSQLMDWIVNGKSSVNQIFREQLPSHSEHNSYYIHTLWGFEDMWLTYHIWCSVYATLFSPQSKFSSTCLCFNLGQFLKTWRETKEPSKN